MKAFLWALYALGALGVAAVVTRLGKHESERWTLARARMASAALALRLRLPFPSEDEAEWLRMVYCPAQDPAQLQEIAAKGRRPRFGFGELDRR